MLCDPWAAATWIWAESVLPGTGSARSEVTVTCWANGVRRVIGATGTSLVPQPAIPSRSRQPPVS